MIGRRQESMAQKIASCNLELQHTSIDCEPTRVFHDRVPRNILCQKLGLMFNPEVALTTENRKSNICLQRKNPWPCLGSVELLTYSRYSWTFTSNNFLCASTKASLKTWDIKVFTNLSSLQIIYFTKSTYLSINTLELLELPSSLYIGDDL